MATVSRDPCGQYFVSFSCEEVITPLPLTGKAAGVDLGVKDVIVTSDGYKSGNPKHLKRRLRHLKRQQRRLSRMAKGSNRRARQKLRVARIHARIANSRADFLHKQTTRLIRENDVLAVEDLNVKGMAKNHQLAGAVNDVGMHELRRQLEYKAHWHGRQVEVIDRWAPTSKMCSECGVINESMPKGLHGLRVRGWTCECGVHHDRDVNAAKNILKFSTAGNAGIYARGQGKNLSASAGTLDESRTDAEKLTQDDCLEQAA
jgi:putative transposase